SLESHAHRIHDSRNRVCQRFAYFFVGDCQRSRNALDQVASLDLHLNRLFTWPGRAKLDLNGLRRALADQEIVLSFYVLDYSFVELVTSHANSSRVHNTGQRDDCDVGRTPADGDVQF